MRKVAIFAEGQSALIFVRQMLFLLIDNSKLSFDCWEWHSHNLRLCLKYNRYSSPEPEIHFLIIDARNDEGVLTALKERQKGLLENGFEKIIALRDMYSQNYRRRAGTKINDRVTNQFITEWQRSIQRMSNPSQIKMHISIMELEAWFLGMYNIFERIDGKLTVDFIADNLGFNLESVDPQKEFFHPTEKLSLVLALAGRQYGKKSRDEVENICSQINTNDLCDAFKNGRCSSFRDFYEEMSN